MANQYETIIIGAGPAGQEAGLFLGRAKVKTMLIGLPEKSDLAFGKIIGNYFGLADEPSGMSMLTEGVEHLKQYGVEVIKDEAINLEQTADGFVVTTASMQKFSSKTVIIATGQQFPTAGIKGEKDFLGRGVATCVACDGPLFKGKKVAVVGNGAHAAEEAIELSTFTDKITIYSQGMPWEISDALMKALAKQKIPLLEKRIASVEGEKIIQQIAFKDKTSEPIDGVFLAMGSAGGITFANKLGLEMDAANFIKIDRDGKTNVSGIWAAGGVTGGNQQIAKSAGEGCNAAISIIKTIKGLATYADQT